MKWANHEGIRKLSSPIIKDARCPSCGLFVIPKCGRIKRWHWAHKVGKDCDDWKSEESEWHLCWKNEFPEIWQEVVVEKDGKKHRADIKSDKGIVIEFQSSSISEEDIMKRESFYGVMKWVLNGATISKNIKLFNKGDYFTFKWKWFPRSWLASSKALYIDMDYFYKKNLCEYRKIKDFDDEDTFDVGSKSTVWEEYADGNEYPHTEYFSYKEKYGKKKEELLQKAFAFEGKLFLIKKISSNGTGWGKLVSKESFIRGIKDGYIGDK